MNRLSDRECSIGLIVATGECQEAVTVQTKLLFLKHGTEVRDISSSLVVDSCTICPDLNKVLVQATLFKVIEFQNTWGRWKRQCISIPVACCVELQVPPGQVIDPETMNCLAEGEVVCEAQRPVQCGKFFTEDLCIRLCASVFLPPEAPGQECCARVNGGGTGIDQEGNDVQVAINICPGCNFRGTINFSVLEPEENSFRFISINSLLSQECTFTDEENIATMIVVGQVVETGQQLWGRITAIDRGEPAADQARVELFTSPPPFTGPADFYDSGVFETSGNIRVDSCPLVDQ